MSKICDNIIYLPIEDIQPYEGSHKTDSAIVMLAESLERFGVVEPISVTPDHVIITGNGVYRAAVRAGIKELPCVVVDYLTDEQVRQYRIADNKTGGFAVWNEGKLKKELSTLQSPDQLQFCFDENLMSLLGRQPSNPLKPATISTISVGSAVEPEESENLPDNTKVLEEKAKAESKFRDSLNGVDKGNEAKPARYFKYTCSSCGRSVTIKV